VVLEGKDEDDATSGDRLRAESCGQKRCKDEEKYFCEAAVEVVAEGCEGHRE
jgi:hypothetical protein